MEKSYIQRFQKFSVLLMDPELANHARKKDSNTFTRDRKMPLKDMLLCCLSKKGLTTIFELRNYFKQKEVWPMQLSVQGYLQQRKRLDPEVFSYLNSEYLKDFYSSDEVELWNGYLLLAIDGSKAEVPNSRENRERFGQSNNQHSQVGQVRALVSGMYDVLNRFYLDIEIEHISISENELAKQDLRHLKNMNLKQPILVIFDRGYPAIEFVDFLESQGIHYLFRLSSNDYIVERTKMKSHDETVLLTHTSQRLTKIRKKHLECYEHMKEKGKTQVRISVSELPSGKDLTLMTNLPTEITPRQLSDLYYQRWEIEKKYHTLKNKMKFESVTGKSTIYVYQDFWSQILVYNMIQDIRKSTDKEVAITGKKNGKKYPMHTNENMTIGLFKESILQKEMENYVLPIRVLPNRGRKKNLSNKYRNNQKNSF